MLDVTTLRGASAQEYVLVSIRHQTFALEVGLVREIRGWSAFTPMSQAPEYVLGLIDLRGTVLPVVDLGARIGLGPATVGPSSVVVVAEWGAGQVGLLVDEVLDIMSIDAGEIQPAPGFPTASGRGFVSGLVSTPDGILTVLDPAETMSLDLSLAA